jgi:hypothetical protein
VFEVVNSGEMLGTAFLLFDNCIGRKRDVGGVVLAGLWVALRFGRWRELMD